MAISWDQIQPLARIAADRSMFDYTYDGADLLWPMLNSFVPIADMGRDPFVADSTSSPNWFARFQIRLARGGAVYGGTLGGPTMQTSGPTSKLIVGQGADPTFPSFRKVPSRSFLTIKVGLKKFNGVMTMNQEQILAKVYDSGLASALADPIEDATYQWRHPAESMLWSDGSGHLASVYETPAAFSETAATEVKVTEGTFARFIVGQRYIVGTVVTRANYGTAARTMRASANFPVAELICVDHNETNQSVYFMSAPGHGAIVAVVATDILMPLGWYEPTAGTTVNACSRSIQGMEGMLINSGTYPYTSHDVANYRPLRAFMKGSMTTSEFRMPDPVFFAELGDALYENETEDPPICIAEAGIWTLAGALQTQGFHTVQVPNGAASVPNLRIEQPIVGYANHTFVRLTSRRIARNKILFIRPTSFRKAAPYDARIQWLYSNMNAAGYPSVFEIAKVGDAPTETAVAPFSIHLEVGCIAPSRNGWALGVHSVKTAGRST